MAVVEIGRPTLFHDYHHRRPPPIFTMQRHEGKIFAPMAYSVVAALMASLILSLTWPLSRSLGCLHAAPRRNPISCMVQELRAGAQNGPWQYPVVLLAALAAWPLTVALVPQLARNFCPELNEVRSGSTSPCRPRCRWTRRGAS